MSEQTRKDLAVSVFVSYAHKDERWRQQLEVHLHALERQGRVFVWHDRHIVAGTDWAQAIDTQLATASIILLLVSPHFIASDYCYGIEMERALQREEAKEACVIPILLRSSSWQGTPLARLQALPKNARPITMWRNKDQAWLEVVNGIEAAINNLGHLTVSAPPSSFPRIWNVPYPRHPYFTGREELLSQLVKALCSGQTTAFLQPQALNGLPGVGKTALAVELAYNTEVRKYFHDGVLWAGLGCKPNKLGLLSRWGVLLGVTSSEMAKLTSLEDWATAIHTTIGMRRMLLLVDDAWEIEDAWAFKLGGPNCAHLLTTRLPEVALRFASEGTTVVHELSDDDGLALLERLAPNIVTSEPSAARALVRAVGGLPLALTLMGNFLRVQVHSHQPRRLRTALEQLQNIEKQLHLAESRGPLEHHPSLPPGTRISLRAVIEISDLQLDEQARSTFYALSVFPAKPNNFSEEVAAAVCCRTAEIFDILTDIGLLESSGPDRYTLHQSIANYARLNRLDIEPEKRMVEYFVSYVDIHETEYALLDLETTNVLAALQIASERGMLAALVQGANKFSSFLEARGQYAVAEDILNLAQQAALSLGDESGLAATWLHLGRLAEGRGNFGQAEQLCQEGLAVTRRSGDQKTMIALLAQCGAAAIYLGAFTRAEQYLLEGLTLAREIGHHQTISLSLKSLGEVADSLGDDTGEKLYQEGLALAREAGDRETMSTLLQNLGAKAVHRGDYTKAEELYQEGLALAHEIGHKSRISALLMNLGMLEILRKQYKEGEQLSRESLELAREIGDSRRISSVLQNLGILEYHRGNYSQAGAYLQESLEIARESGESWLINETLCEWGELNLKQGKVDTAFDTFNQALVAAREMGAMPLVAMALYGIARVASLLDDTISARHHGQESLTIFKQLNYEKANEVAKWLDTL